MNKFRVDIRLAPHIGASLLKVRTLTGAPSMAEMCEAILEDWLRERRLLEKPARA